ncbi:hypothetical protein ACW5F0_10235 [Luteimonas sp. A534]
MEGKFTVFEYVYRDAGNFKTAGCLLLSGQDPHAEGAIRPCLEWADQFVAEQIGVPALCEAHWESVGEDPSDLDHAFHELLGLRPAKREDFTLNVWGSVELMVSRMQTAAGKWDVALSPNCDL